VVQTGNQKKKRHHFDRILIEKIFLFCCSFFQATKLRPNDARTHTNLGAILHLLGKSSEAALSYKEALKLQPDDLTTLTNLAKLGISEIS
jgi:tetratricopeptide (TPR) repeat protein